MTYRDPHTGRYTKAPHYYWNDVADYPVAAHRGRAAYPRLRDVATLFLYVYVLTLVVGVVALCFV